jgi:hypothetical protein
MVAGQQVIHLLRSLALVRRPFSFPQTSGCLCAPVLRCVRHAEPWCCCNEVVITHTTRIEAMGGQKEDPVACQQKRGLKAEEESFRPMGNMSAGRLTIPI